MSKSTQLVGVALFIGAMGFAVRAASAYTQNQGDVWLDYEPPVEPKTRSEIDFSWLNGLFGSGSGGSSADVYVPPSSGGVTYTPTTPVVPVASTDVLTLARTIYGEAASETQSGKEAVANVVMNRVRDRRWPSNVASVCRQPWQFSCWNASDAMRSRIENLFPGANSAFNQCLAIAETAVKFQLADRTRGATHYYASYIAQPSWIGKSPDAVMTTQIGVHKFYRGIA